MTKWEWVGLTVGLGIVVYGVSQGMPRWYAALFLVFVAGLVLLNEGVGLALHRRQQKKQIAVYVAEQGAADQAFFELPQWHEIFSNEAAEQAFFSSPLWADSVENLFNDEILAWKMDLFEARRKLRI